MLDGGGPELQRGILEIFVESARIGNRASSDRQLAWAAHHTQRMRRRDATGGQPTVIGGRAYTRDGWSFEILGGGSKNSRMKKA